MNQLSPLRARLASFENAYAVAVQKRRETGLPQFVLRTDDPVQPFRTAGSPPLRRQSVLMLVA